MATSCVPAAAADVCANCGKGSCDAVKLKKCTACQLVKYCSVDCQRAHRKHHKGACKKRAAELEDEQLYGQGHERPEGDFCPICTLPIPFPMDEHSCSMACCMKRICIGCSLAAQKRGMLDCAFCRIPFSDNDADNLAMIKARVQKKDPDAIHFLGQNYFHGQMGVQKDIRKAVELTEEAAELGSIGALFHLGLWYTTEGVGVEVDEAKGIEFCKKAAMQGDADSRHWMISAKLGHDFSVESIKNSFVTGVATKEQYAEALRGYQDAVEETKSHDRDLAMKFQSG
ncbi:hypothetical protein THAOC_22092 [Thalassiosira oceanica]|uniref:MYND-type domain-containing protein n=1 Tax=Thalassiosira oceanica TaxID=159749 RepID=K0RXW3_THAOC|nr:hypothetical protein THAOC_22092 [Thalassiosira oceanica]|eukprot:EJK57830.1 hypothetical protein THAOC_22092 [Thalassiosira oceanica]